MLALYRTIAFGVFVVAWWATSLMVGGNLFPTPLATAEAAAGLIASGELAKATGQTLAVYLAGYAIAAMVAIPLGLLIGAARQLERTLDPFVNAFAATPRVAFVPLIIAILGLGFNAKVSIVFLGAVIPILINTLAGVANADGELIEMARSTGADRIQIFRKVVLPGATPFVVAGLRLGAAIGLINTVVAELYTAVSGLGGLLAVYGNTFRMAPYFVVVLTLAAIGGILAHGLKTLETRSERWRYDAR